MPAARRCFTRFIVLGLVLAGVARAEVWTLANGDRLTGELVEDEGETLEIKHAQLGLLKLPKSALRPEPAEPAAATTADTALAGSKSAPAATTKAPAPAWKRQFEVGFSQQSGTKSKEDLNLRAQMDGRRGDNTFRATARLLQSEANDKTVTDRREADFRWRHDLSKRLFAQTLTTYAADDVRAIDLSLEQQIGGGYRLIDDRRHKASIGLGAVVQYLEREGFDEATALLGSFFQDYTYTMNSRVKLMQESNVLVSDSGAFSTQGGRSGLTAVPRDGSYRMRFNTAIQSKVTSHMSLNLRYEYDYDRSVPDPDLRGDQRLTTSLGYVW